MVKRTTERGCPVEHRLKKRRQTGEESGKLHVIPSHTDDAAMRRVQDFLGTIIPGMPGVLRDTTNCQILAEVPTQAWCACYSFSSVNSITLRLLHAVAPACAELWQSGCVCMQGCIAVAESHAGSCMPGPQHSK
jgi:hypothetical protein